MEAEPLPSSLRTDFPSIPPFPSDVPTVPLLRLSLRKLLRSDRDETARLWDACTTLGFFYLDLRDATGDVNTEAPVNGGRFLEDADKLFDVADEFYALPVEEKEKYDFKDRGSYFGYKGFGQSVNEQGSKDRNEFYNISKDDILGIGERMPAPALLDKYRPLMAFFMRSAHAIVIMLLSRLSDKLHLPASVLTSLHKLDAVSGDQVRWVRAPPQPPDDRKVSLGAHTDFGSITLLFNKLGGLQVRMPSDKGDEEDWRYVRPLPGHCIVNLGDATSKFTNGLLKSSYHRVINPPGEQSESVRMSLVYFSRPEDSVMLKTLSGSDVIDAVQSIDSKDEKVMTAKDWILARALSRRGVANFQYVDGTQSVVPKPVGVV